MKKVFFLALYFFACLYSQSEFFGRTKPQNGAQVLSLKILPGALIGDYSGSLGSSTFSHNKGGPYMKNKSIPTNQQNPAQIAVRAGLIVLSAAWRSLTAAQRTAWDSLATQLPKSGPFGLPKFLTGHQTYISCNQNMFKVAYTPITDPGAIPAITTEASATVNAAGGAATLTIAFPSAIVATEVLYVRMSAPLSAGLANPKGVCKFVASLDNLMVTPWNAKVNYENVFGTGWQTAVGSKIFIEISVVDTLSGLTTMVTRGFGVIAA